MYEVLDKDTMKSRCLQYASYEANLLTLHK